MAKTNQKKSLLSRLMPIIIIAIVIWYFWPSGEVESDYPQDNGYEASDYTSSIGGTGLADTFFNWMYADTGSSSANNSSYTSANSAPVYGTSSGTGGIFGQDKSISGMRERYTDIKGGGNDVYTIMVYMVGSDLESDGGCATADLQEMLNSRCGGNVNLIIQTGGCRDWNNNLMADGVCERWQIKDGQIGRLEELGKKSMVDTSTLGDFVTFCKKNFPANRYGFIFWDHGGGSMMGFGSDEIYASKTLMLSDIDTAFTKAGVKFDFVGYDACLMGSIENAYMLEKHADYLIASEELEPGWGWDYTYWLAKLTENTATDTVTIGQWIVDDFISQNSASDTLSVIELREIPYAYDVLCDFMDNAQSTLSTQSYTKISNARAKAKAYADGQYEMVDIVDVAYKSGVEGADEVVETIASVVKYRNNCTLSGSYGLSMYFPYKQLGYYSTTKNDISKFGYGGSCTSFFDKFVSMLAGGKCSTPTAFGATEEAVDYSSYDWYDESIVAATDYSSTEYDIREIVEKDGGYVLQMSDEDWSIITGIELQAMQDDGEGYIDLGSDQLWNRDEDGDLRIEFDNTWVSIDGQNVAFYAEREENNGDDNWFSYGYSPAILNGDTMIDLVLCWSNAAPDGYVAGYRIYSEELTVAAKGLIALQPGDKLDFVCDYYDYDGNYVDQYYLGETMTVGSTAPVVSYEDIGVGSVLVCYKLTDIYQNVFFTETVEFYD